MIKLSSDTVYFCDCSFFKPIYVCRAFIQNCTDSYILPYLYALTPIILFNFIVTSSTLRLKILISLYYIVKLAKIILLPLKYEIIWCYPLVPLFITTIVKFDYSLLLFVKFKIFFILYLVLVSWLLSRYGYRSFN